MMNISSITGKIYFIPAFGVVSDYVALKASFQTCKSVSQRLTFSNDKSRAFAERNAQQTTVIKENWEKIAELYTPFPLAIYSSVCAAGTQGASFEEIQVK